MDLHEARHLKNTNILSKPEIRKGIKI